MKTAPVLARPRSQDAPTIPRTHLLKTLDWLLESHSIVVVEGPDGMGKTTLLRQFAAAHGSRSVSLFVSGASRWAYDPRQLQHDLYVQLATHAGGVSRRELTADWRIAFAAMFSQLRKISARSGLPFQFVVDGLEDIPPGDDATKLQIIDLLPFGYGGFRFVLSARAASDLPLNAAAHDLLRVFTLPFFSPDEAARYFDGFGLTTAQLAEVMKATSGLPAKLASIRRLLASGADPDALLSNLPEQLPELFNLEWKAVDKGDDALHLLLALLAHDNRAYRPGELSELTQMPEQEVRRKLDSLPFVDRDTDGYYRFPTEPTRRFVAGKLGDLRHRVNELLITHLTKDPDSPEAVAQLPALYFSSSDRLLDLVHFLSPERFARIYQDTPSLKAVQQHADRGIEAARKLGLTGDLLRFSLHRCAIEEIANSQVAVAEVRARTAVGDYDNALALAEAAPRYELRLQLLVAMASVLKEHGAADDLGLLPRIRELLDLTDAEALGPRLPDVAADLFHVSPELAIELVGGRAGGARGENALDWARTRMAIQAQIDAHLADGDPNARKRARDLQEQIKDPALRRLSMQVVAVIGRLSGPEVIAEASRLESAGDKLFLLQHWMLANRERPDASQVLEQAVRYALQATDYTATAKVYRELAICLPHVSERERLMELVDLLEAQRGVLERIGPTEDYIRLRLIMARAVSKHDPVSGQERLMEVYNEIAGIADPVTKLAATARLAAALARVDPARQLDDALHGLVDDDLTHGLETVLERSAEHFEVCRGVIQALAVARPADALATVAMINTEYRRDLGYRSFVDAAIAVPTDEIPVPQITEAFDRMVDPDAFDAGAEAVAFNLAARRLDPETIAPLGPLLRLPSEIHDLRLKVRACAMIAASLKPAGPNADPIRETLLIAAWEAWVAMDSGWERLETGLEALASIARTDPEYAEKYIAEINNLKRRLPLPDVETATAAIMAVMLAIRAYAGVVRYNLDTREDLDRLFHIIALCGSSADQGRLLTELAIRSYFAGRQDLCERIAQQRLNPLIDSLAAEDAYYRRQLIIESAPALYFGSPAAFRTQVRRLDTLAQDDALASAAWTLLTRTPPTDPYEHRPGVGYDVTYEQACAVAELMREMTTDWRIYGLIEALVDSALLPAAQVNRAQKQQLAETLEEVAASKFPSGRFIRHEGYLVIARAQINRLRIGKSSRPAAELARDARDIPNTADRAYVLAVVGAVAGDPKVRRKLLDEARGLIAEIPMLADRLDRYELLSTLVARSEPAMSKELFREAITLAVRGQGDSVEERRRSLINAAYRFDPEFAAGLAQLSDDDPAKSQIERQMAIYRVRDAIAARRPPPGELPAAAPLDYSRAAWLRLGMLNAGRTTPVGADRALPLLQYAVTQPVSEGYPLFALFIENAVRGARSAGAVRSYLLPLFEACLRAGELALLTARPHETLSSLQAPALADTTGVIDGGEREKALALMRDWLARQHDEAEFFIVEPYFKPDDVHLLALLGEHVDNPRVTILTSRQSVDGLAAPYEEHYRSAWRQARQDPLPETTVVVVATRDSKRFPPHDRWWLTRQGGVELGTSFGGLGLRISRIRELTREEAETLLATLSPYFRQQRVEYGGERVLYWVFMLE